MSLLRGMGLDLRQSSGGMPKLTVTAAPSPVNVAAGAVRTAAASVPPPRINFGPNLSPLASGLTSGGIPLSTGGNLIGGRSGSWINSMVPITAVSPVSNPTTSPVAQAMSTFRPFSSAFAISPSQPAVTQSLPSIGPSSSGGGGGTMLDDHGSDVFGDDAAAKMAAMAQQAEADAKRKRLLIWGGVGLAAIVVGVIVFR